MGAYSAAEATPPYATLKGCESRYLTRSHGAHKLTVREENSLFIQPVTQRNATLVALHHAAHTTHTTHAASSA